MNPKVLITGHPNSGTSFLCNLVAEMGFSPGDPSLLKPADDHNPYGYWEHVPLQNYVRGLSGYGDWMHVTGAYPEPLRFTEEEKQRVRAIANSAGIEVFKETGLPVMYHLFPNLVAFLAITRDRQAMYNSSGANYKERGILFDEFSSNVDTYEFLLKHMMACRPVSLFVYYEDFYDNFDGQIRNIASFLGVEPDLPRLREVWRPRT